jgi:hypothetical protein
MAATNAGTLRQILAALERQRLSLPMTRGDTAALATLLPPIGGAVGFEPFLVRDLFKHPSTALRLVLRGQRAIKMGRLFQRAAGHAIDGYLVERAGAELHTALWRVLQVVEGNREVNFPPSPHAPRAIWGNGGAGRLFEMPDILTRPVSIVAPGTAFSRFLKGLVIGGAEREALMDTDWRSTPQVRAAFEWEANRQSRPALRRC